MCLFGSLAICPKTKSWHIEVNGVQWFFGVSFFTIALAYVTCSAFCLALPIKARILCLDSL
jgi:hypothetical protein